MNKTNNSSTEILKVIEAAQNIVTPMDSRYDFDSYCSVLAVKHFLNSIGKKYDVFFDGQIPERAKRIYPQNFIVENTNPDNIDYSRYDLIIYLDSGTIGHISKEGNYEHPKNSNSICIDHHGSNTLYGTYNYVFPSEASTTDVLYKFFKELSIEIDIHTATLLLTGIMTDTGFFQFTNTKPKDLRTAAELWEKGVNVQKIIFDITNHVTLNDIKVQRLVLNKFVLDQKNKLAYVIITPEDLIEYGLDIQALSYPVSDIIKKLEGINFAVSIKSIENEPNIFNVSFRSHEPDFDVARIAIHFGGGGHKAAAGANIEGSSAKEVLDKIYSYLAKNL